MTKQILIGGEWRGAAESIAVRSPFDGEMLAEVASTNESETQEAVAHAERAAEKMRRLPRFEIAKGLRRIAENIEKREREFAETIAKEAAKPIKYAVGEVTRGIATFNWRRAKPKDLSAKSFPLTQLRRERENRLTQNEFRAA